MSVFRKIRLLKKQLDVAKSIITKNNTLALARVGTGKWKSDITYESFCVADSISEYNVSEINNFLQNKKTFIIFVNSFISNAVVFDVIISDVVGDNPDRFEFLVCRIDDLSDNLEVYYYDTLKFVEIDSVSIISDDIDIMIKNEESKSITDLNIKTSQVFGKKTTNLLSQLTIGIVGVSGTGSIVAEQLYRMNTGTLILVDNDIIEERNLGRVINSSMKDCNEQMNKAQMMKNVYDNLGLDTKVIAIPKLVSDDDVIRCLSQCDILIGCMDSIDGRHQLNLLSSYYVIPYFDVGVKLQADGNGGVDEVTTAVHYLIPGESSLLSRRVYNSDTLSAATLSREDPEEYRKRLEEKYIIGAGEGSPAVISVNMIASSMAVLEVLARIHPFREEDNSNYGIVFMDLMAPRLIGERPSKKCMIFEKYVGKGDVEPLLGLIQ